MRACFMVVAVSFIVGCNHYGESTSGEENRSTWRIDDGLCPGTEGGCAMTVPVAAGIEMSVDADVLCAHPERNSAGDLVTECDLADFDVEIVGADSRAVDYATSEGRLDLRLFTTATGNVAFELSRTGSHYDRTTMEVREPVDIECGRVGAGGASWDMRSLSLDESYAVDRFGADRETKVELGCRLLDDNRRPLFSGSAIEWQILDGTDIATVDDGGLFGTDASTGARVWVRFDSSGTILLEAHFGSLTRQIEIVVR